MLRRAQVAVWERLGHRGLFLILLGVYDLFYGLYLVRGGPVLAATLLPERAWGWVWIGCGMRGVRRGLDDGGAGGRTPWERCWSPRGRGSSSGCSTWGWPTSGSGAATSSPSPW